MKHIKGGLLPLPKDDRDFQVGALFTLPDPKTLPDDFVLDVFSIKDQQDSDFCSAFAVTGMSELQEGVELSPEWSFAVSKMISGDPENWGQDLRVACKTLAKYGSVPKSDAPFAVGEKPREFLVDIKNWPSILFETAKKHQKSTYLSVQGPYDTFDNIRASLYKFASEKRGVLIGLAWGWPLEATILDGIKQGFGHAMYVRGWRTIDGKEYLVVQNSWGEKAGEKGTHYISREVINYYVPIYGAYMLVDKAREDVEYMLNNGIKFDDSAIGSTLRALWNLVKSVFLSPELTNEEKNALIETVKKPLEEMIDDDLPDYMWDTKEDARHSIRVIGDEERLTVAEKDLICAVIQAESGFNTQAKNENKNLAGKVLSTDWGICQINDYYHIGPGRSFASVEEVLEEPEKSVRWMIKQYRAGNIDWWIAHKNGSYKKYL